MKKVVPMLLLLLFINPFSGKAQQYYPFPENNAFWLVSWGTPSESSDYHYELTGDTLIGLFNYHKLESAGNTYYSFDPNNPQFYNNGYVGAYRNDTLTKKVYYFPKDSINESLLYDFNMVTGDTIQGFMAQLAKNKFGSTFYAIIDSVDSVLVNSVYRKRWYYHTNDFWGLIWGGGEIIEGIGTTYGLLEGLLPMFDDNGSLVCYSENGSSLYGISLCLLVTNIKNTSKIGGVKIYPNPIIENQSITITSSQIKNLMLEVYDLYGKRYYPYFEKNKNGLIVDTSVLPINIYIFLIKNETKEIVKQKIIKLK